MTSLYHGLLLQAVAIQSILGAINHLRSTVGNIGNMVSTILMATHTSAPTAGPALQAVLPDTTVGTPLSVAEHLVGGTPYRSLALYSRVFSRVLACSHPVRTRENTREHT